MILQSGGERSTNHVCRMASHGAILHQHASIIYEIVALRELPNG